jgi:hypothetical protein
MRIRYWVLALTAAFAVGGCTITAGDGDIAAGFSWSWEVMDVDYSVNYTCADVGAEYAVIRVTDSEGVSHEFYWLCDDASGETDGWEIATGTATVTADLVTSGDGVLSTITFEQDFESGSLSNDLGLVQFGVDVWDPEAEADASLWWQWQFRSECIPFEDTVDGDWPTEDECIEEGIDHVDLFIWNPNVEQWWIDDYWSEQPCGAFDQDDGYFWAGLWFEDFIAAGNYQFFLGFYGLTGYEEGGDTTEVLLYYDTRGTSDDPHNGDIEADDPPDTGYNDLGCTALDVSAYEFGVLKINLLWGQSQGGVYDSCLDSTVAVMGFLLRNDGWVAAEVPLSEGVECLDWLVFEEVPILADPYELLVSAISDSDDFLWYNLCVGLEPEDVASVDDAMGLECEIANQLAQ